MAGLITGEALYALLLSANHELAYTWRVLPPYDKDVYITVATMLNGTYLAPLARAGTGHECRTWYRQGRNPCSF